MQILGGKGGKDKTTILGKGDYRYETVVGWGKPLSGREMGVASGVATDSQDRVYVVDREPHPAILVFDRAGRFLTPLGARIYLFCLTTSGSALTTASI